MIKSLNDTYKKDNIFYYCNTCGDVNIPNTDPFSYHKAEELPLEEHDLYDNFWREGRGCNMHVVNYEGNSAMALGFLFQNGYCDDLTGHESNSHERETFWKDVSEEAEKLSLDAALQDCDILLGEDTDPDGHEILIVVPYSRKADIDAIVKHLNATVYADFKAAFKSHI